MQATKTILNTSFRCGFKWPIDNLAFNHTLRTTKIYTIKSYRDMSHGGPIYTAEYLSDKLRTELDAEHVDIEDLSNCNCGMKFNALVVSPKFENQPPLQRQRLVNKTLAEEMKHIHALTMRTMTPSQWKEYQEKNSE